MISTFRHLHVVDPRRRVEVEVGDAKQEAFVPQLKTLHWGSEASFSIRLVDEEPGGAKVRAHRDGGVEWVKGARVARWYPLEAGDHEHPHLLEDGGHEFEVELAERPASNVIRFTVRAKRLRFYFQPPLTAEEEADGAVRPDAVVGSYAVYHESKAHNRDDVHYRTGKAFHVLRPHAEDADGARVWCDLEIPEDGNGEAAVTVPQEFLNDAVYPVVVDPTFGYTTSGGSGTTLTAAGVSVCSLHTPLVTGAGATITDMNISGGGLTSGGSLDLAAYTLNGTPTPVSRLAAAVSAAFNSGGINWYTASGLSQTTAAATYDVAAGNQNQDFSVRFDAGSGSERSLSSTTGALPSTWSEASKSASIYSIYATYTAAVTAVPSPVISRAAVQRAASW